MTTISIMGGGAAQPEINAAPAKKRGRPRKSIKNAQIISVEFGDKSATNRLNAIGGLPDSYALLKNRLHIALADREEDHQRQRAISAILVRFESYGSTAPYRYELFKDAEIRKIQAFECQGEYVKQIGNPEYKAYLNWSFLTGSLDLAGVETLARNVFLPLEALAVELHFLAKTPQESDVQSGQIVSLRHCNTGRDYG